MTTVENIICMYVVQSLHDIIYLFIVYLYSIVNHISAVPVHSLFKYLPM